MPVTVYSKPHCPQCVATVRWLERSDIPYTAVDLTQDQQAFAHVESLGYKQVPVVEYEDQHWSGFRPDLIKTIEGVV